jgi:hypothetical protein
MVTAQFGDALASSGLREIQRPEIAEVVAAPADPLGPRAQVAGPWEGAGFNAISRPNDISHGGQARMVGRPVVARECCCMSSGGWLRRCSTPDGTLVERDKGTLQGSAIPPLLANLFMHYAFDAWMAREFPDCPSHRRVIHATSISLSRPPRGWDEDKQSAFEALAFPRQEMYAHPDKSCAAS